MQNKLRTFAEVNEILVGSVEGYQSRAQQLELAATIESAMANGKHLLAQAPTGVGKSIAYLVPAALSVLNDQPVMPALLTGEHMQAPDPRRIIVATATKQLQTQLFDKDLPNLARLIPGFTYASLKGRTNYLCLNRAEANDSEPGVIDAINKAMAMDDFSGELDDLGIDANDKIRAFIKSDSDECSKCTPDMCYYARAKEALKDADIGVVNHDVLIYDLRFGHLGKYQHIIIDEAHLLEESATRALGDELTPWAVQLGANAVGKLMKLLPADVTSNMKAAAEEMMAATSMFFKGAKTGRLVEADMAPFQAVVSAMHTLSISLGNDLLKRQVAEKGNKAIHAWESASNRVSSLANRCASFISESWEGDDAFARIVEQDFGQSKALKVVPIRPGTLLQTLLFNKKTKENVLVTTTLVSATLPFKYAAGRLGVTEYEKLKVSSPFDYPKQGLLYIPADMPSPQTKTPEQKTARTLAVAMRINKLVKASKGGALLLFTSKTEMDAVHRLIVEKANWPYTILKQGQPGMSNRALALRFADPENKDSVLFGLKSFMTGVDFPGDSCRLVVVDKLPFPFFKDPLFEARAENVKAHWPGVFRADFHQLSVPMMSIDLEQAVGRLIRTTSDRGVVAILDPRIHTEDYGTRVLQRLPEFKKVNTNFDLITRFFAA